LELEIEPQAMQRLREKPRDFVQAVVREGSRTYSGVGVHLKGSIGTFRSVDEKADWTLDFSRFNQGQTFHGLRRIHLNNSLEDPGYLNERLGSTLFNKAGIPTPRVSHALLALNSRKLGLFVLKEGFTEDFLKLHFKTVGGDLYEPGMGVDADTLLKRNSVKAPFQGNAVLTPLEEVVTLTNPAARWQKFRETMDVERVATFMALEIALGHRDGYCLARNNFRVYYDLDSNRLLFLPHGMDQLFGAPEAPWNPTPSGAVAKAFLGTPEGRALYRKSMENVLTNTIHPEECARNVDQWVKNIKPHLESAEFKALSNEAQELKKRIEQRHHFLLQQMAMPEPVLFSSFGQPGKIQGWQAADLAPGDVADLAASPDGVPSLHLLAGQETTMSWRTHILLPRGHYHVSGRVLCEEVHPLPYGSHQGAALRVVGRERPMGNDLTTRGWRVLDCEFTVEKEQDDVELVCEFRAKSGQAWFDREALQISRSP
jgi:hypothetical protein